MCGPKSTGWATSKALWWLRHSPWSGLFVCDVLIAGAGPIGVTLAVLLAKRGVTVIVAEKEAAIYPLPRAAHIDHEGMRILQEAGASDAIMAVGRPPT